MNVGLTFLISYMNYSHFPFDVNKYMNRRFMFETMINALIVHNYMISYVDELLLNKKFGDWVKARLITWYFQFLITQYED